MSCESLVRIRMTSATQPLRRRARLARPCALGAKRPVLTAARGLHSLWPRTIHPVSAPRCSRRFLARWAASRRSTSMPFSRRPHISKDTKHSRSPRHRNHRTAIRYLHSPAKYKPRFVTRSCGVFWPEATRWSTRTRPISWSTSRKAAARSRSRPPRSPLRRTTPERRSTRHRSNRRKRTCSRGLAIDAFEGHTRALVWRGTARAEITPGHVDHGRLRRVVASVLQSFPRR